MWVRTQNEDALYHVAAVRAVKMISERTYSVIGILLGASTSDSVVLGEYKDYATAKAEVDHMDALLMKGTSSVYHMTKVKQSRYIFRERKNPSRNFDFLNDASIA